MRIKTIPWFILACTLTVACIHSATWQEILESQFDIVETFDQLQDWSGEPDTGGMITDPEEMPKKLDNSSSIWQSYASGPGSWKAQWIGDHGAEYNWRSEKSLCMNYGTLYCEMDDEPLKGYGPDRLGTYFGDGTPQSGYRDIYVFFMMKIREGWFWNKPPPNDDEFSFPPAVKIFDINSGFTGIAMWGNTACASNVQTEYGTSFSIWNISAYGTEVFLREGLSVDEYDSVNECYKYYKVRDGNKQEDTNLENSYNNGEWFGVEIHLNLGSIGEPDGDMEVWTYDENGAQIGFEDELNVTMQTLLNYNYNRFAFGGNYQCTDPSQLGIITETRFYIDDFIVDDQRIGPSYFALLNNQPLPLTIGSLHESAVMNTVYSSTISVRGGQPPYSMSVASGRLPEDLTLNSISGNISGIPKEPGSFPFTLEVVDSTSPANTASREFSLTVSDNSSQAIPLPPSGLKIR